MRRLLLLWRFGREDLLLLWFALRHPSRPAWLLPVAALLGLFALDPANFAIPFVGMIDDLVLLPMLLHIMVGSLPADMRSAFRS